MLFEISTWIHLILLRHFSTNQNQRFGLRVELIRLPASGTLELVRAPPRKGGWLDDVRHTNMLVYAELHLSLKRIFPRATDAFLSSRVSHYFLPK